MTFDEIKASDAPRVVLFYGTACAPCKRLKPVLREMSKDLGFELHEINVASEMPAVRELEIRGVPTLVTVNKGEVEVLFTGEETRPKIALMLHSAGVLTY